MPAKTINVKEFALQAETEGRTARKFLRSITPKDDQPGKGGTWTIRESRVPSLLRKFSEWDAARRTDAKDDETAEETITVDVEALEDEEILELDLDANPDEMLIDA